MPHPGGPRTRIEKKGGVNDGNSIRKSGIFPYIFFKLTTMKDVVEEVVAEVKNDEYMKTDSEPPHGTTIAMGKEEEGTEGIYMERG